MAKGRYTYKNARTHSSERGGKKNLQIVLNTENLDKELRKSLILGFQETVNVDNNSTSAEEL
jgi:hypothetical protein